MLTSLRKRVTELMASVPVTRKPALRRSDEPDMLLATDLPGLTDSSSLEVLLETLTADGWSFRQQNGWLLLDHELTAVQYNGQLKGEAACVLRLLQLHSGGGRDCIAARCLAKAAEQGSTAVDKVCWQLHRQYAADLRMHRQLPDELIPILLSAASLRKE